LKVIGLLFLISTFFCHLANAQSFPELKKNIQLEQNIVNKISLLVKARNELSQYNLTQQAEYWFMLGTFFEKQNKMHEAMNAFTEAISLHEEHKLSPTSLLVNLLIQRSRVITNLDHFNSSACTDRALALSLSRELAQPKLIAKSIAYFAKCLQTEEDGISKSLELFDEAFDIAKNTQLDPLIKQIIFNQAATLSFRALIYDKAYEYNKLAFNLFTKANDINSIYNSILNSIHYSTALVDIPLAWQHLAELDNFAKQHPEFNDSKLKYYYLSAKVAQLEQNWPLSITYLEAGLAEVKNSQNVSYIQATYELLSIAYFRVGKEQKSYQTLAAIEKLYPTRKPIKKEVQLIKGVMAKAPVEIAQSAFDLINKERQLKNDFVKQANIQAAHRLDDNLKQLDNVTLEQQLVYVISFSILIIVILGAFAYIQLQRRALLSKEKKLTTTLISKKNQLLSDVSHELATPISVLKLQVESLKDDLEEDVQASYDALDNKIIDIEHLINDIHQLAQSDLGTLQLNITPFEINESLDLWENELTAFVNKNKLTFEISKALPNNLMVHFDRDRIKQIFSNLLTNSIKYTDKPGQVKLSAVSKNNTLFLSIEDSAPGVSDEDLVNIFERLYRVEDSRSRETGGSGLGLAICKSLIEEHKGKIYAKHSSLGGLKIVMELPC